MTTGKQRDILKHIHPAKVNHNTNIPREDNEYANRILKMMVWNEILFSNKNKQTFDRYNNLNESQMGYAE